MNADLIALAERVEKAEGPDLLLDAEVAAATRTGATEWAWAAGYPAWEGRADGRVYLEKGGPSFAAPPVTASLDAAMTLVPSGHQFGCGSEDATLKAWAWVGIYGNGDQIANAATPALALTAAALRDRASVDTHPQGGDVKQAPFMGGAVAKPDAPNQSSSPSQPNGENNA